MTTESPAAPTRPARPASQPATQRAHSSAHRLEYALIRSLEEAVMRLPERRANAFGKALGRTIHRLGVRRDVVIDNLRTAFPDRDRKWINDIARMSYEHLGREAATMLRLSRLDRSAVLERTTTLGWDAVQDALALGNGLVLVTGHYGNWEIAAATIAARGLPISAIARRQGNRLVDERLRETRRKLGVETVYQGQAPTRVPRILRANGVVGIVGDQDARRAGVFVPFFGRPASTHRGPALFAMRLDAPVFTCVARRLPGAASHYEVALERVAYQRTDSLDNDVVSLTANLARRLEEVIRRDPSQYFWFHRRWKSTPPDTEGLVTSASPTA
ncbi:MAG: lysophospholipid acyltransferase family protein [Gemmatimonadaceae bacterium]